MLTKDRKLLRQALEAMEQMEHLLTGSLKVSGSFMKEKLLTDRLRVHWGGANSEVRQIVRHADDRWPQALAALRRELK